MKNLFNILFIILVVPIFINAQDTTKSQTNQNKVKTENQEQHGNRFIDLDGDGFNDNAPDHDGDGIPNGIDPDYQKLLKQYGKNLKGFVDADGDGINDHSQKGKRGRMGKGNNTVSDQNTEAQSGSNNQQSKKGKRGSK